MSTRSSILKIALTALAVSTPTIVRSDIFVCCPSTPPVKIPYQDNGMPIGTPGPEVDEEFDAVAKLGARGVTTVFTVGDYLTCSFTGGIARVKGGTTNTTECCNNKEMVFNKWTSVVSTVTLPSGTISIRGIPVSYLVTVGATASITSSPGIGAPGSPLYMSMCSVGAPNDTGILSAGSYNDCDVTGLVSVSVTTAAGYRFVGNISGTVTATLAAKATVKFITDPCSDRSRPREMVPNIYYKGIENTSVTLTVGARVEVFSDLFGDWKLVDEITTIRLV